MLGIDKYVSVQNGYGDAQRESMFYLNPGMQPLGDLKKLFEEGWKHASVSIIFLSSVGISEIGSKI